MNKYITYFIVCYLLQACTSLPVEPPNTVTTKPQPVITKPNLTQPQPQIATPQPTFNIRGFRQQTYAIWYNILEHGNPTANGDIYDYYAMSAAHSQLPLGAQVRVRDVESGHSIIVTINDRQPTPAIKLSIFAAKQLGVWNKINPLVIIEDLDLKRLR